MTAVDLIKQFEGCRLTAYQDQGGVWTVGYGCTGPQIVEGTVWTQEQADQVVLERVTRFQEHVLELVTKPVSPDQLATLVSLAYNIGLTNFQSSSVLKFLNRGDYGRAADAFTMWIKVAGEPNDGLINRRNKERAIFLAGMKVAGQSNQVGKAGMS